MNDITSKNGSSAAAPRDTQSVETSIKNIVSSKIASLSNKDKERQRKWFDSGVKAKKNFGSYTDVVSPFYENATADYFFKCGYDGVSFVEAQQVLKDKLEQVLKNNPVIDDTLKDVIGKGFNEMLTK